MADTWQRAPIVFEWFGNYDYLKSRNWSFDAAVNFMLSNHVTLINDNVGRVPPEAMPPLEKLARLAGARFVLRELSHPQTVKPGTPLNLRMQWANVGVGKLHRPSVLRLFLLDRTGQPVVSFEAKADPRDWLPGEHRVEESIPLPASLQGGDYIVSLRLEDPLRPARAFRLAMDAPEREGRYEVSQLRCQSGAGER
jgi:hypothetical protein